MSRTKSIVAASDAGGQDHDFRSRCRWLAACAILIVTLAIKGVSVRTTEAPELYFVAVGDVSSQMVDGLVLHFERKFGIRIQTLSPLTFDEATFDAQRSQVVADRIIRAIRFRYPVLAKSPNVRVIGITSSDMYMDAMRQKWSFTFSLRSPDGRFAVVSYARMNPVNLGAPPNDELLRARVRKMIAKNIGIIYFGLSGSNDPRSVLFRNVLGVDDLDRMTEEFSPK